MKYKLLILATFVSFNCFSQDFRQQFNTALKSADTSAALKILTDWKKSSPKDPECYVAYFNYYATQSMQVLSLDKEQHGGQSMEIKDPKTGKVVGYLNEGQNVNITQLDKGFKYIDTAIRMFPSRLDMRFGEIYMLGKIPDYDKFTTKLVEAITYGKSIDYKWTWTDNKPVDQPSEFMLSSEQTYINQLYNDGKQLDHIETVASAVLKFFPDNVENLSNLSIVYLNRKQYPEALKQLLKANQFAPQDAIVLNNIAYCYKLLGDKPNAIKYYELTEKYGNENEKNNAELQLKDLQKPQ